MEIDELIQIKLNSDHVEVLVRAADYVAKQDEAKSFPLYNKAARLGSPYATLRLGQLYLRGCGCEEDEKKAIRLFAEAGERGEAFAYKLLGRCFRYGWGTAVSYPKEFGCYKIGAEKGDLDCVYALAECYEEGRGCEIDYQKAGRLFLDAAEEGIIAATYDAARFYRLGRLPDDENHSLYLGCLREAAEDGYALAKAELSENYYRGRYVASDPAKAYDLVKDAETIDDEYPGPMLRMLGLCLVYGKGVKADPKRGYELIDKATYKGSWRACYDKAVCLEKGLGVPVDMERAISALREGVDHGVPSCRLSLGVHFLKGKGVDVDEERAVELIKEAYDDGAIGAAYWVAYCYENDVNDEFDMLKALDYYQEGVYRENDPRCMYRLGVIYRDGKGFFTDKEKAAGYFKDASALHYAPAMLALAECYRLGEGVEKDEREAKRLTQEAERYVPDEE